MKGKYKKLAENLKNNVRLNEPLDRYTTLNIGGPAKLYLEVKKETELIEAIKNANKLGVKYLIIAGGSNLLISDRGFNGLVIRNLVKGIKAKNSKILVKSATELNKLISFINKRGFKGMECMVGIPGSVGGAVYGNAGAYGQEIKDNLTRVKVFNSQGVSWFSNKNCKFGYRDSIFKTNNFPILEVEFQFAIGNPQKLINKSKEIIKLRQKKYPKGIKCPGSFFKNILKSDLSERVLSKIPEEKIIYGKIPAGYLLEAVGARGRRLGNIKIAGYHGNLFINLGNGKATDFFNLAKKYGERVEDKFGIKLVPEVQLIGFSKKL